MNLLEAKLLFLDLQTTGASPANGSPLEIAWSLGAADDRARCAVTSYLLQQPEHEPVPKRIQALTGITDADMEAAVDLNFAQNELREAFKQAQVPAFMIHYAQFERPFLKEMLGDSVETMCTHQIAARLFPNLPSRGIRGLAGYFGFPLEECKRAETHVVATRAIWKHLCEILAEKGINTWCDLRLWLEQLPKAKRTAYEYPLERGIRLSMPDCPVSSAAPPICVPNYAPQDRTSSWYLVFEKVSGAEAR